MNTRHFVDLGNRIAAISFYKNCKHSFDSTLMQRITSLRYKKDKTDAESREFEQLINSVTDAVTKVSSIEIYAGVIYDGDPRYQVTFSGSDFELIQNKITEILNKPESSVMTITEYMNIDELPF